MSCTLPRAFYNNSKTLFIHHLFSRRRNGIGWRGVRVRVRMRTTRVRFRLVVISGVSMEEGTRLFTTFKIIEKMGLKQPYLDDPPQSLVLAPATWGETSIWQCGRHVHVVDQLGMVASPT